MSRLATGARRPKIASATTKPATETCWRGDGRVAAWLAERERKAAEKRAKEMIDERRDEEAEKNALRDALRATSDEFERGRAAGWAAALRLPSREYVRAQMKLEKEASDGAGSSSAAASATGADATAAAFSEISLDEKDVENSSLTERVSNVFKEAFVGVKKRVDQLEKLNRTP